MKKDEKLCKLFADVSLAMRMNPELRYGQALWIVANETLPLVVVDARGTSVDPFYSTDQETIKKFIDFISDNI